MVKNHITKSQKSMCSEMLRKMAKQERFFLRLFNEKSISRQTLNKEKKFILDKLIKFWRGVLSGVFDNLYDSYELFNTCENVWEVNKELDRREIYLDKGVGHQSALCRLFYRAFLRLESLRNEIEFSEELLALDDELVKRQLEYTPIEAETEICA